MNHVSEYLNQREISLQQNVGVSKESSSLNNTEPPNDSEFKKYILYVDANPLQRNNETKELLDVLSKNKKFKLETYIQGIEKDSSQIPQWLKKLPTLVLKEERKAYIGEDAIKYIKDNYSKNFVVAQRKTTGIFNKK
jgi:hypothetical protein